MTSTDSSPPRRCDKIKIEKRIAADTGANVYSTTTDEMRDAILFRFFFKTEHYLTYYNQWAGFDLQSGEINTKIK